jgi:hypothetical protein
MNFYRVVLHADWMLPYERERPDPPAHEYFVMHPRDIPRLDLARWVPRPDSRMRWLKIYEDPVSGVQAWARQSGDG